MMPPATQRSNAALEAAPQGRPLELHDPAHGTPDLMSAAAQRGQRDLLVRIIRSYENPIVRAYCRVRFVIIHQDFLNEIGQYLPSHGSVLDIGCGFGLFGLYFAGSAPQRRVQGYDLSPKRVAMARLAARTLGLGNARFDRGDAVRLSLAGSYDAIYALDLVHHLPFERVPGFVAGLHRALRPGGVLLIKDVDRTPAYKRWFTLALDRLMVGWREPVRYWSRAEMREMLRGAGFEVRSHTMRDVLPYPHVLYVCHKPEA
ncbi:MAG: class I SAM-dependent methyltransferase [Phycisphaerae bacterium]|jgi:2-polyprenyl-3-methyl-5-hydroxy-6-metoxy-1,4-benzoquinol methylase|nr:class I SAM-dependent methyltransferase [Phycisphaerae bacterium]MCZ2400326.1 class I SAM-dependent methyltransferase [Phycisphaerae bacterium]NUQ50816.1 class I SAM-dependent methyltransferase [Phycisphaerae bacterium]